MRYGYIKNNKMRIKTSRSEEEQKALNEALKRYRPQLYDDISKKIERVIEIFSSYDNFILLGWLSYKVHMNQGAKSDDGKSELALEYGSSFATAIEGNPSHIPDTEILNEMTVLLHDIRHSYGIYMMTEYTEGNYTKEESTIRHTAILTALWTRGDGFQRHKIEVYRELFSGHDDFFKGKYGFTSNDIIETIRQLENSWYCRLLQPNGCPYDISSSYNRLMEWWESKEMKECKLDPMTEFFKDNPDIVQEDNKFYGYRIDDKTQFKELYRIRFREEKHKEVVKNISMQFGDNKAFLDAKYKGEPLKDTLMHKTPIISHNGEHYLFTFSVLRHNLFEITEDLIKRADEDYYNLKFIGNQYSISRDNYLEIKVKELFSKFLINSESYANLTYKLKEDSGNIKEAELDLLIVTLKANYVVEMKAGRIPLEVKRGALKSIKSKIGKTIKYGAMQSHRALAHIQEGDAIFYEDQEEIFVDQSKKNFRIIITLDVWSIYLINLIELETIGAIEQEHKMPWTCSLPDLMIFCDIMESEDDFIDYLEKRLPLYNNDAHTRVDDEIDLLGYYLEHNKFIGDEFIAKEGINDDTSVWFRADKAIYDYYERGGPKPVKKR
jgi:hypothetical protein